MELSFDRLDPTLEGLNERRHSSVKQIRKIDDPGSQRTHLSVKWIDFCSFGDCVWVLSVADASLPDPLDPHVLVVLVVLVVQLSQARLGVGLAHCTEKEKRVRGKERECGGGREGKRKEEGVRVCACVCVCV